MQYNLRRYIIIIGIWQYMLGEIIMCKIQNLYNKTGEHNNKN